MLPNLSRRFYSEAHPEQMDLPDLDPLDLAQDLQNLEIINRHFGGKKATRFILHQVSKQATDLHSVLDCACGAGDLTTQLALALPQAKITGIDLHPQTLAYAQANHSACNLEWQQADMKQLPFPDNSYDLVTCQLALHHFSQTDAVAILKELQRVSKKWVIVTDITRSYLSYLGIWLLVTCWLRHPMTQHDALLSIRRAFNEAEFSNLAQEASWAHFHHCRLSWFRQALVLNKLG
ncbi:MAG: class I SAM-dependent methyltransferase [Blastochloris sp.]|nr:class I SAM-dependent methyltransferase [Blastochloris sp.]